MNLAPIRPGAVRKPGSELSREDKEQLFAALKFLGGWFGPKMWAEVEPTVNLRIAYLVGEAKAYTVADVLRACEITAEPSQSGAIKFASDLTAALMLSLDAAKAERLETERRAAQLAERDRLAAIPPEERKANRKRVRGMLKAIGIRVGKDRRSPQRADRGKGERGKAGGEEATGQNPGEKAGG